MRILIFLFAVISFSCDGQSMFHNLVSQDFKIGEIFYQGLGWPDLDDFATNGTTPTVSGGPAELLFSGGTGTFTQSIDLITGQNYTGLEKWKITATFRCPTPTATSFGFGVGIRSANTYGTVNAVCRFVSTSGLANDRKALIHAGTANTLVATSSALASLSANDVIRLTVELNRGTITVTALNGTAGGSPVSVSYDYVWDGTGQPTANVGRFSIFNFGGAFALQTLRVESSEIKAPHYMFVGDSKTRGYRTSVVTNRFASLFNNDYPNTSVNAGGFDRIQDVVLKVNEIIALKPQVVFLAIGSNDKRQGVLSDAQIEDAYDALVTTLTGAGIRVIHLGPILETSIDVSFLYTHIAATYSVGNIIDPGSVTLDADGVHPNNTGHNEIYSAIIASGKL